MGSCISAPAKAGVYASKKLLHPRKHPGPATRASGLLDISHTMRRSSGILRSINIVKDPSGDNVHEKYKFGKELGRGEFGVTYHCTDIDSGDSYACKTISKSKLRTEIDVEDVRREVEIMRHLPKHPNIVTLREAYEDRDAVYLVMEQCEGGELFDRIVARGHFSERAAASITKTIVEVVKVCHEHGVIHRDLKPENFLFANRTEQSTLKAIDFGLSTFFRPGQRFREIVGSPYYMAPEVLRRDYGPEVDIWSAGVILYILLCGVPPFWAETEEGIAQAIVLGEINFERDPWPKVSAEAKDLVQCMLDPNPYDRFTVDEVLEHTWIQNMDKAPNISLGENVRTRIKQFSLMNKFKKKVLRVVADNLPDEQIDPIRETFYMMDTDQNGDLSFEELKNGLHKCGQQMADPDVRMLMDAADVDGNGTIDCEEFVTMSIHLKRIGCDEHLSEAFSYFDKNKNGYIEFDELREVLDEDAIDPDYDKVIQDILFDADLDKDGRISFGEFKAMMKLGADWKMSSRQYSRALLNALSQKMFKEKASGKSSETCSREFKILKSTDETAVVV